MMRPVLIIGAGGHGKVVADILQTMGRSIKGFLDDDPAKTGTSVLGIPVLGPDDTIDRYVTETVELANGMGSVSSLDRRRDVFERFRSRGFQFVTIVHPDAIVSAAARMAEGVQVMAGAIVQPGVTIGVNTIVNTGAIIDHDCSIGPHCHIAPGCTLSGAVEVEEGTHVGTGASIIQGIRIGAQAFVGAGAVVVADVSRGARVLGIPAKQQGR